MFRATCALLDLKRFVQLPPGEDLKEWVACHTIDFYNQVTWLYGTICSHCKDETCPIMNAGHKVEYYWADGETIKRPVKLSAYDYFV